MNNLNLARQFDQQDESAEHEDPKQKNKPSDFDLQGLSAAEFEDVKNGRRSIDDIAAEREDYKKEAEVKLKELATATPNRPNVIDLAEYKTELKKLEDTNSPDKIQEIIDRLEKLPEERAKQKADEEKERKLDDPALVEHTEKIYGSDRHPTKGELNEAETIKCIGTKQQQPFISYFKSEIASNPTIKNAKALLKKLHEHHNGLKPRREFFEHTLAPTLKKYELTLDEAPYLEAEGLSERQDVIKKFKDAEKQIDGLKQAGLYSFKAKKQIMKEMLKADNPTKIAEMHRDILDVTKQEAKSYTDQNNSVLSNTKVIVNGVTVQAMSQKSIELFLTDYQQYDMKTRKDTIPNWKKIAENEGKLIKDLGEVYKEDPEGFKEAVKVFALLSYQEKETALKEHKNLVTNNDKETVRESNKITAEALSEIESARSNKVLGNKTAKEFRAWVNDNKNYKDEKTGKLDLEKQRELVDKMKDKQPIFESKNRNIAAYKWVKEQKFEPLLKKVKTDNPDLAGEELKDFQEEYNEGTFSERKETYLKLKKRAAELDKEREENKDREETLGIKKEDKEKMKNQNQKRTLVIDSAREAITNKEEQEITSALRSIYFYLAFTDTAIEKDPELKALRDELEAIQKNISSGEKAEQTFEEEIETEMESVAINDTTISEDLEEAQIKHLNIELAKQSEYQHDREKDAQKRGMKESLDRTEEGSIEEELTEDFYAKAQDKKHVLDEEGYGEEVLAVEFDDQGMDDQDLNKLKSRTHKQQDQIDYQQGAENIVLVDDSDRLINSSEAEAFEEANTNKELKERLAEKAEEQMENRNTTGAKVFDLQSRIAARRKAEDIAEDIITGQEEEKLRAAS